MSSLSGRRQFLGRAAIAPFVVAAVPAHAEADLPLSPPPSGKIDVAFLISEGATVIDFTGPWEVFQDTMVTARGTSHDDQMPFRLFTVADGAATVRVTGGLQVTPDYTVDTAPTPKVIVIPAMRASDRVLDWLRRTSPKADLTMSVCAGAFVLAAAGLLKGRSATTHHDFLDRLAQRFPDVKVERGRRFVEGGPVATAAGLTSGIDLALRVVERYFGRATADTTARYMEYERSLTRT
jgi:transcriptional regulator GlxA family with amidase domain